MGRNCEVVEFFVMPGCYIIGRAIGTRHDEKNRLVSTRYADGSFSTNAYSCCRLLWTFDRNGMKTVTSASADVRYAYTGAGSRVAETVDAKSGETRVRLYDVRGDGVGERINGVSSTSVTQYEQGTNGLWRVTTQERTGQVTNVCTVLKERLTGLSDELRSEIETYRRGVLVSRQTSSFDPETLILTEVEDDALSGRTETQSKFGRVITTTTSSGTVNGFFDAYGRVFYSEKDGRSVDWIGRNDFGDVEEYDVFHASGDSVYADFYGYDVFGNRI